jgi:fructan beta-fructosidase
LLKSKPVDEINNYKVSTIDTTISAPSKSIQLSNNRIIQTGSYDLNFSVDLNTANTLSLAIGNSIEKLVIAYDKSLSLISIDRSASGNVGFNTQFQQKIVCPYIPKNAQLTDFKIVVDKTSMELFVDGGEKMMTALFFPNYQYNYLKLQTDVSGNVISNFKIKGISKSMLR